MVVTRISILIAFITFFYNNIAAQTNCTINAVVNNLYNEYGEKANIVDKENTVYIIHTQKNCLSCFEQLCDKIVNSEYKNHKIALIGAIEYDLLQLVPYAARQKKDLSALTDVLFHFTNKNGCPAIYQNPSPQLIIKSSEGLKYLSYAETIKLMESN